MARRTAIRPRHDRPALELRAKLIERERHAKRRARKATVRAIRAS